MDIRIKNTIKTLEDNHVKVVYLEHSKDVFKVIDELVKDRSKVGIGGSKTLLDLGFIDYLRNRDIEFLDRYQTGLTNDQLKLVFRNSFFADYYITGTNAITEDGAFFNIDGRGNRVASMIYGPEHVIIVVGVNKIVQNEEEAIERTKLIAAPLNALRLNSNTPCVTTGSCVECDSDGRICRDYVLIKRPQKGRFTLILINETLGF